MRSSRIAWSDILPERIKKPLRRARYGLSWPLHVCYVDSKPDPARSVFLCGAGRSGTTWLSEVINYANEYRFVWEPFRREHVRLCRDFDGRGQYLRPGDNDPKYLEPARAVFSGRVRHPHIDQFNRRWIAKRRLIKDCRSNLMLKWIRDQFPQMPIIFLIRHPCAVALSRTKLNWRTNLKEDFFQQQDLMTDYLAPFVEKIAWTETAFERHTVYWCIEHFLPFSQLHKGDVYLVFYENILANPKEELRLLFHFLKQPFEESVLKKIYRPSALARKKGRDVSAVVSGDSIIDGWRKYVSADQLDASRRITELFGLDQIYGGGSLANVQSAQSLFAGGSGSSQRDVVVAK